MATTSKSSRSKSRSTRKSRGTAASSRRKKSVAGKAASARGMGSARGRGSSRGSAKKSASAKKSTKAGARRGTGILGKLKSAARGRGTRSPVARVKRVTKTVVEQAKVGVQRVGGMAGDLVERVT